MTQQDEARNDGMDDEERAFAEAVDRLNGTLEPAPKREAKEPEPEEEAHESEENPPESAGSSHQEAEKPNEESDEIDFESLPEAVQKRIQKLENERKAAIGQNQPYQRKVAELEQKLRQLAQNQANPPVKPPEAPQRVESSAQKESKESDLYDSSKWQDFERDYPEAAEFFRENLGKSKSEVERLKQDLTGRLRQMDEFMAQARAQREQQVLREAHPDWQELVLGGDTEVVMVDQYGNEFRRNREFQNWYQTQHPNVQALLNSDVAQDNIYLLDLYKSWRDRNAMKPASPPSAQPRANKPKPDIDPTPRQRAPVSGPNRLVAMDDEEAEFASFVERTQFNT